MEKLLLILVILILLFLIGLSTLCVFIFLKVRDLQQGDCVGVPKFNSNSVYTKTISVLGYKLNGKATFNSDNTFLLDFGNDDIYKNNKWIYDNTNCSIVITLDPELEKVLDKYNSSIDQNVKINKKGDLIVNAIVEGAIPLQIILNKN